MQKVLYRRNYTVPQRFAHPRPWLILPGCHIAYMPDRDRKRTYDFSGHGNHGEYHNVSWKSYGRFGPARYFDGFQSFSYIDIGVQHFDYVSISVWVRPTEKVYLNDRGIVGNNDAVDMDFQMFVVGDANTLRVRVDTSSTYTIADIEAFTDAKRWHHFVFTYDGAVIRIYRNGKIKISKPHAEGGPMRNTGNKMYVGVVGSGYIDLSFHGEIDEIQVYNRALTDDEVKLLYDIGKVRY